MLIIFLIFRVKLPKSFLAINISDKMKGSKEDEVGTDAANEGNPTEGQQENVAAPTKHRATFDIDPLDDMDLSTDGAEEETNASHAA
jgi:hypothetical protein